MEALIPAGEAALRAPAQTLPGQLLTLLERRYLADFAAQRWTIRPYEAHGPRPLLHRILEIGRPEPGENPNSALPQALAACHGSGHLVSVAVHGDGAGHRFHWGGRRLPGVSRGSTEDFLRSQGAILGAALPGLRLSPAESTEEGTHADLAAFIRTAPALAVMTGIPSSLLDPATGPHHSLDRLTAALGTSRYAVVVAAEPLSPSAIDVTLDLCRRLRGDLHGLVRRTLTDQQGESRTTNRAEGEDPRDELSILLSGAALFFSIAAGLPRASSLGAVVSPAMQLAGLTGGARSTEQTSVGTSTSQSVSGEILDAAAEACARTLERHIERMDSARALGWWRTAVYLAADSEGTLETVAGVLRGICAGAHTSLDPLRVVRLPAGVLREAALSGHVLGLAPRESAVSHPLGPLYDALATNITSAELAVLVAPPRRPVPGLRMRDIAEFALAAPDPEPGAVPLGRIEDSRGNLHQKVTLTGDSLNRHVFIGGMTGYGKTTTAKNLLLAAHTELEVPFLVIEPAKTEYRSLRDHPALRGGLTVYGIGADAPLPLRLNPFVPVAATPLSRHLDLLKAVFNASFPMFAGMSYVLEDAMLEVYTERGWDLHSSANDLLGERPSAADLAALVPSVGDLYGKIEQVLERRSYGQEVHQNLGAALRSRIGSLLVGTKGMALDTRRSVPVEALFERPAVIELSYLSDDEEKAFVMALLLCLLYEHAESRGAPEGLRHLTLIEEAHRLLRASRHPSSGESADPQAKAVAMFTDMLSEMRAYGEGFVVADQVPTKLAPDIIKNSNVKILHRLAAEDDRAAVSSALGLTPQQSRHLAGLRPGLAVVHDERIGAAVLTAIEQVTDSVPSGDARIAPPDRSYLHRHGGCRHCPNPCTYLRLVDRPGYDDVADKAMAPFFDLLLLGAPEQVWDAWRAWRKALGAIQAGVAYCAAAQAARRHLAKRSCVTEQAGEVRPFGLETPGSELLTRDRAARILARLFAAWLPKDGLDAEASAALATCREDFTATVASRPPAELPGCAECPARCLPRSLVGPAISRLQAPAAAAADRDVPVGTRIRQLDTLAEEHLPAAYRTLNTRSSVLYCVVVNASAHMCDRSESAARKREETLTALRTPPR